MERLIGPLAGALARQREALNARFALACGPGGAIDPESFLEHLAKVVDPIVRRIADVMAERVDSVTAALFDVSLELFAAKQLGPEAKQSSISQAWEQLLGGLPTLLAREPRRLAASISNALANLAATPGARTEWWIERLLAIGPECATVETLLECGKVLAWQSGMVRWRAGALNTAERLPPHLSARALGLEPQTSADELARAIGRLRHDPWLTTAQALQPLDGPRELRLVGRVGEFRGFGGVFLRPPNVGCRGRSLFALDGEGTWELLADAYGSGFLRTSQSVTTKPDQTVHISADGRVQWGSDTATISELCGPRSYCVAGDSLAVTLISSHHLYLLARVPTDGA